MAAKLIIMSIMASIAAATVPTAAFADDRDDDRWERRYDDRRDYRQDRRHYDDRRFRRDYAYQDYRGGYNQRNYYADTRFNGGRNNFRCRDNGTGGTIIGALAGGLLGNQVAGRGDRLLGTVIGGGVGAIAGREIDRRDGRRC